MVENIDTGPGFIMSYAMVSSASQKIRSMRAQNGSSPYNLPYNFYNERNLRYPLSKTGGPLAVWRLQVGDIHHASGTPLLSQTVSYPGSGDMNNPDGRIWRRVHQRFIILGDRTRISTPAPLSSCGDLWQRSRNILKGPALGI